MTEEVLTSFSVPITAAAEQSVSKALNTAVFFHLWEFVRFSEL
jgi:hypothetical protein